MRLLDMTAQSSEQPDGHQISAKCTQVGFGVHHWGYFREQMDLDSNGLVLRATRRGSLVMQTENARRMMRRLQRTKPDTLVGMERQESDQLPEEGPAEQVPDDTPGQAREEAEDTPGTGDDPDDDRATGHPDSDD
jgi:hypothetical protein